MCMVRPPPWFSAPWLPWWICISRLWWSNWLIRCHLRRTRRERSPNRMAHMMNSPYMVHLSHAAFWCHHILAKCMPMPNKCPTNIDNSLIISYSNSRNWAKTIDWKWLRRIEQNAFVVRHVHQLACVTECRNAKYFSRHGCFDAFFEFRAVEVARKRADTERNDLFQLHWKSNTQCNCNKYSAKRKIWVRKYDRAIENIFTKCRCQHISRSQYAES